MKKIFLLVSLLVLSSCVNKSFDLFDIIGHWRNDDWKIDYIFSLNNVEIVSEKWNMTCSYETNKNLKTKTLMLTFRCPQPDWPWYTETHEFVFDDSQNFIDTKTIQWVLYRIDGKFYKINK